MSLAEQRVAVIGAGIGGLAAAMALAERGARVEVFEQAPALTEVGAGLQVGPNGVAVLEALGVRDGAERLAMTPRCIELRDHRGDRRVARLPLGHDAVTRYGRPYWQFHRADLLPGQSKRCPSHPMAPSAPYVSPTRRLQLVHPTLCLIKFPLSSSRNRTRSQYSR